MALPHEWESAGGLVSPSSLVSPFLPTRGCPLHSRKTLWNHGQSHSKIMGYANFGARLTWQTPSHQVASSRTRQLGVAIHPHGYIVGGLLLLPNLGLQPGQFGQVSGYLHSQPGLSLGSCFPVWGSRIYPGLSSRPGGLPPTPNHSCNQ